MKWKQRGVYCHWLGIILFGLPSEKGPSTDRQKGSVASLTFPFSSSQLALGRPFISTDFCSFRCLWGSGWIRSAFSGYDLAHTGLVGDRQAGDMHAQKRDMRRTHMQRQPFTRTERPASHAIIRHSGADTFPNLSLFLFSWKTNCLQLTCRTNNEPLSASFSVRPHSVVFERVCPGDPFCLFVWDCFLCLHSPHCSTNITRDRAIDVV